MIVDYDKLAKEYIKCISDKSRTYMIESFLQTYDATQHQMVPYHLFPRQQDLCRTLGNANNIVSKKPRQAGITTTAGGFISCEMALADPKSPQVVLVIGNTIDLAMQMVTKIRDFLMQFPAWIWGDAMVDLVGDPYKVPTKKQIFDICNTKELVLKNGCRVVARSSGPDASRGVGGVTWLIFDEAAFIENGNDVYASALPTVSTGGHIIMISTPNGKDLLYYETCRRAALKGTPDWNGFELVDLRWYQDPRYNKFLEWTKKDEESGEIIVEKEEYLDDKGNIKFSPEAWKEREDSGWKPRSPWYVKMCQQFNNDSKKIAQELDVSFLGSASNVVEPEYIEMQRALNQRDPLYTDPLEEDTWVWKEPIEGHRYICSCDNGRGDSNDATAIEILDMDGEDEDGQPILEQVLEYHGKKTGDIVGEYVYKYASAYNNAFVVVESIGGYGDATLLTLMRLEYKNLYYDDPNLKTYTKPIDASSIQLTNDGKLPGFHTSSVREPMLSHFASMVRSNQIKLRSRRTILELDTWIYKGPTARIDHQDGCHDDTLTCMAMGVFVMKYSLNKLAEASSKDKMMLKAWRASSPMALRSYDNSNVVSNKINKPMPFYTREMLNKSSKNPYAWVIGKK